MSTWPAPRALLQREWSAFRAAVNRIFRPAGGDLTHELPLLFRAENRENLRVVVDDAGAVVAHAGCVRREAVIFNRRTTIGVIAAVFTDPAVRGRGLGTRVLLDALGRVRPGADLVLASGDRDLYRRQGFEPTAPMARFRLPSPSAARVPEPYALRELGGDRGEGAPAQDLPPAVLADLRGLHDAEPVHFVRSEEDWRLLLGAGRLVDAAARFTLVERAGRPVAFLATQVASARPDGTMRPRRILEVAGDREAIVAIAPFVGDELLVPSYDAPTIDRAVAAGWVRTVRQFPITAEPLTATARVVPWYGLDYL